MFDIEHRANYDPTLVFQRAHGQQEFEHREQMLRLELQRPSSEKAIQTRGPTLGFEGNLPTSQGTVVSKDISKSENAGPERGKSGAPYLRFTYTIEVHNAVSTRDYHSSSFCLSSPVTPILPQTTDSHYTIFIKYQSHCYYPYNKHALLMDDGERASGVSAQRHVRAGCSGFAPWRTGKVMDQHKVGFPLVFYQSKG